MEIASILGAIIILFFGMIIGLIVGIMRVSSVWKKQIKIELGLDNDASEDYVIKKMKLYK